MPQKKEFDCSPPQHSVYRINFQSNPSKPIKEQIVRRPKTSFDNDVPVMSTYRYAHGTANPNREMLSAMSNCGLSTLTNRRVTTQGSGRESVAHCLNWLNPAQKSSVSGLATRSSRPQVPASTEPVTLVPHSPAKARPSTAHPATASMATTVPSSQPIKATPVVTPAAAPSMLLVAPPSGIHADKVAVTE